MGTLPLNNALQCVRSMVLCKGFFEDLFDKLEQNQAFQVLLAHLYGMAAGTWDSGYLVQIDTLDSVLEQDAVTGLDVSSEKELREAYEEVSQHLCWVQSPPFDREGDLFMLKVEGEGRTVLFFSSTGTYLRSAIRRDGRFRAVHADFPGMFAVYDPEAKHLTMGLLRNADAA